MLDLEAVLLVHETVLLDNLTMDSFSVSCSMGMSLA